MVGLFESTSAVNDIDRGRAAVQYFHNRSLRFPNYRVASFQDLISQIGQGDFFLEGVGLAINSIDMRESQVKESMELLADRAQGLIPDRNSFYKILSDRASNLTFIDYVYGAPEISAGIAKDTVAAAQQVGETVKFFTTPTGIIVIVAVLGIVGLGYLKVNKII